MIFKLVKLIMIFQVLPILIIYLLIYFIFYRIKCQSPLNFRVISIWIFLMSGVLGFMPIFRQSLQNGDHHFYRLNRHDDSLRDRLRLSRIWILSWNLNEKNLMRLIDNWMNTYLFGDLIFFSPFFGFLIW